MAACSCLAARSGMSRAATGPESLEPREELPGAIGVLLVVGHFFRIPSRFVRARETEVRHGGVEPRRRDHAPAVRDVALASRDLPGLAIGRILRRPDSLDLGVKRLLG